MKAFTRLFLYNLSAWFSAENKMNAKYAQKYWMWLLNTKETGTKEFKFQDVKFLGSTKIILSLARFFFSTFHFT